MCNLVGNLKTASCVIDKNKKYFIISVDNRL